MKTRVRVKAKKDGLSIDDIIKKLMKMVATRLEQERQVGRTKNYENVDDVENKTSSPELEVSKVSGQGRREERTNNDEDVDDVENETSSPELEVSKVRRKIWANAKDKKDINDINDDSERGGS